MARSRNIKPGFFLNDVLAEIKPLGRLLFIGLWTIADKKGRLEDRPKKIKAACLPYDNCDIDSLLSDLQSKGFIIRYQAVDNFYIQIINWSKHQQPHIKEKDSEIPAYNGSTIQEPDLHHTSMEEAALIPDSLNLIPDSLNLIPDSLSSSEELTNEEIEEAPKFNEDSEPYKLAIYLRSRILENRPKTKVPKATPHAMNSWSVEIDRMIRIDGRELPEIQRIIEFATTDSFWIANILSAAKLRKQYDQLALRMGGNKNKVPKNWSGLKDFAESRGLL